MKTLEAEIDGFLSSESARSIRFDRVYTSHGRRTECELISEDGTIAFGTADSVREAFDAMKIDMVGKRLAR